MGMPPWRRTASRQSGTRRDPCLTRPCQQGRSQGAEEVPPGRRSGRPSPPSTPSPWRRAPPRCLSLTRLLQPAPRKGAVRGLHCERCLSRMCRWVWTHGRCKVTRPTHPSTAHMVRPLQPTALQNGRAWQGPVAAAAAFTQLWSPWARSTGTKSCSPPLSPPLTRTSRCWRSGSSRWPSTSGSRCTMCCCPTPWWTTHMILRFTQSRPLARTGTSRKSQRAPLRTKVLYKPRGSCLLKLQISRRHSWCFLWHIWSLSGR
mmetsp:Transcript_18102/g.50659  ORF Transcript_18102/g.50659 Transcript_18102/m.50659 type:complete len:259 (+) Transcript_18102:153-929(+)